MIEVRHDGDAVGNDTVDLRVLRLGGPSDIQGKFLVVPAKTVVGISNGSTIQFRFGNETIDGTVNYRRGSSVVSLNLTTVSRDALLSSSRSIRPVDQTFSDESIAAKVPTLAAEDTTLRYSGDSLALENPLFELLPSDEEYAVRVYDSDGQVRYANYTTPEDGTLSLPREFLYSDIEVAVWTRTGNFQILQRGAPGQPYSVFRPTVSGTLDGANLSVGDGDRTIRRILYQNGDGPVHVLNVTRKNGTYRVENASVLAEEEELVYLIPESGRILKANLNIIGSLDGDSKSGANGRDGQDSETTGDTIGHYSFVIGLVGFLALLVGLTFGFLLHRSPFDSDSWSWYGLLIGSFIAGALSSVLLNEHNPWTSFSTDQYAFLEILVVGLIGGSISAVVSDQFALRSSSTRESPEGTETIPTTDLSVDLRDRQGNPIDAEVQLAAKPVDRTGVPRREEAHEATAVGGQSTLSLPNDTYKISARIGDHSKARTVDVRKVASGSTLAIALERPRVQVSVSDTASGRAISDAKITLKTDGAVAERSTNAKGESAFRVPYTAEEVEVEVDADRYESSRVLEPVSGSVTTISTKLDPKTGDVQVAVTIDGRRTGGLPIAVRPGDDPRGHDRRANGRSDSGGEFTARKLLVGEYRVGCRIDGTHFTEPNRRIRVDENDTTKVTLDARFEWSLSSTQRRRIRDLREAVGSLSDPSNRDVAIPRYFGSVVDEMLNTVESLPDSGHHFATADVDPDELADGMLDAAEVAIEHVDRAMSAKTNMDLFVACSDMADPKIRWSGEVSIEELFERTTRETAEVRNRLARRVDAVNDRIERERSEVAEIAPVETMWEETRALLRESGQMDSASQNVTMYATELLLDAIEQLFDHPPLQERMTKTVF
jgi:hypothetical protein